MDVPIVLIYFYITIYVCVPHFYDLSVFVGCWSSVSIRRIIYKFLNVCPFDYTAVAVSGKVELVNRFNHTSWVTAVTPTDRPKSIRNSCVIKVFGGVLMLSRCFLDCSVGVGVFVTGLSQTLMSSFHRHLCLWPLPWMFQVSRSNVFQQKSLHILLLIIVNALQSGHTAFSGF